MSSITTRDINDAWLRALAEYEAFKVKFTQDIMGNDASIAIGQAFEQAQMIPGLADLWKKQDPDNYARAAQIAGNKEA